MFCTNCGSKLPEGSNFCSVCGARLVAPETPNNNIDNFEPTETKSERRSPTVSFDWSNVKEESHKRKTPEVHSPWGTTELSDNNIFNHDQDVDDEKSRTMSFIDILKQERNAKAKAAEEETRPLTERQEEPLDYSAFEENTSYYVPPLYDLDESSKPERTGRSIFDTIATPVEVSDDDFEDELEEFDPPTAYSEPEIFGIDLDADEGDDFEEPVGKHAAKHAAPESPISTEDEYLTDYADDEVEIEEEQEEISNEPVVPETSADFINDLENELADILAAGTGKYTGEVEPDLFEETQEVASKSEPELEIATEPELEIESEFIDEPEVESESEIESEPEIELELEAEPAQEPVFPKELGFDDDKQETPQSEEDEIRSLQERLAELMGSNTVVEESNSDDVVEPVKEEVPVEEFEEIPLFQELDIETEEPVEQEPEEIISEVSTEPEETQESDALSLDELERDLFGEVDEDEIEVEATKKIDKFYTLYKKNEEFQKLLDEEYNKLKTEDVVPHVDDFVSQDEETEEIQEAIETEKVEEVRKVEIPEEPVKTVEPIKMTGPVPDLKETVKTVEKEETSIEPNELTTLKEKAAKVKDAGSKLTVVAVILAAILVLILAIILVLYCAPDSALAWKIDSILGTITSNFSALDFVKNQWLL